jgi:hypothetical protein
MTPEHLALFPSGCATPSAIAAHQVAHARVRGAVGGLGPLDLGPKAVQPVVAPEEIAWVRDLVGTADFQSHYSHLSHDIGYVRIDQLTLLQESNGSA